MITILLLVLLGLVVGLLSGLLGIGGGVVFVPVMVLLLNIPQHIAQGISMLVIIPTAIVGVIQLHKYRLCNYRLGAYLAIGAVCGAFISSGFAQQVPADVLRHLFGIFVIITALKMILVEFRSIKK
ncbi:MAG: Sulfite exporter TauE/SafE [Firmicutes bacterium]|nr:Sulfite exporter TauE/SafE [Bacillota bacterium]